MATRAPWTGTCRQCEVEFQSTAARQFYCSEKCKRRFRHGRPHVTDRLCAGCGETFTPTTGHQVSCSRSCAARVRRENTPAEERARKARDATLRLLYKMSLSDWEALFDAQGRACAICETTEGTDWHTDHDHACCPKKSRTCGRCVRGILCGGCNKALGHFGDDVNRLMAAAAYLIQFQIEETTCRPAASASVD